MPDPHGGNAGTGPGARGGAKTSRAARASSAGQKALDLLVFAPTGLLVTAVEEIPEMAAKGRSRLDVHLRNAGFIGQMVVTAGQGQLRDRVARLTGPRQAPEPARGTGARSGATTQAARPAGYASTSGDQPGTDRPRTSGGSGSAPAGTPGAGAGEAAAPGARTGGAAAPAGADWAIPGYDTLSASQVVRRLDALGVNELVAVSRHEAETRGRRTILHRVQQLLGAEEQPGQPGMPG